MRLILRRLAWAKADRALGPRRNDPQRQRGRCSRLVRSERRAGLQPIGLSYDRGRTAAEWPLLCASRPFMGPIRNGSKGSMAVDRDRLKWADSGHFYIGATTGSGSAGTRWAAVSIRLRSNARRVVTSVRPLPKRLRKPRDRFLREGFGLLHWPLCPRID